MRTRLSLRIIRKLADSAKGASINLSAAMLTLQCLGTVLFLFCEVAHCVPNLLMKVLFLFKKKKRKKKELHIHYLIESTILRERYYYYPLLIYTIMKGRHYYHPH